MLVDCGHDSLVRDDHPPVEAARSSRIYAGDFLQKHGVEHLDILLITHFHRDHIGGLARVLQAVTVGELVTTYIPPAGAAPLDPDGDNGLPKAARNVLRCLDFYAQPLEAYGGRIGHRTELAGDRMERRQLTEALSMDILFGEPALYPRQKAVYDAAFRGERNGYDLIHWGKSMNVSSLRQRLYYHGKEIVLGGDAYAHMWETETATPCDILKVPPPCVPVLHDPEVPGHAAAQDRGGLCGSRPAGRAAPPLYHLPAAGVHRGRPVHGCGGHPRAGGAGIPGVGPYRTALTGKRICQSAPPF